MRWHLSWRADPRVRELADRHYSRQKIGAEQFVPPGRCVVLVTEFAEAAWVTSWPLAEYVHHAWAGAWVCSLFRNEQGRMMRSSDLVRDAVAATRAVFGDPPPLGFVTFVAESKVRKKRDPGRCYLRAGWHYEPCWSCKGAGTGGIVSNVFGVCDACAGDGRARTKTERHLVLSLPAAEIGPAVAPLGSQTHLWRHREQEAVGS